MTILKRIAREPVAVAGVLIAVYGVAIAFGWFHPTPEQTGALSVLGGAIVTALRWLVTPASEVAAQRKPGEPVTAGPAANLAGVQPGDRVDVRPRMTFPPAA